MKKGIILDKRDNYYVVMSSDGSFHKTKAVKGNVKIGDEIKFFPSLNFSWSWIRSLFSFRYTLTAFAIILLALIPFFTLWNQGNHVYAYVNIDINPSVELVVNHDLEVTDLHALNQDGENIIANISNWEKQSVEKVTMLIIDETEKAGYLVEDLGILIGVSYLETKDRKKEITQTIQSYVKSQKEQVAPTVTTFEVPKDVHEKAVEENMSMNYMYAQQLIMENDFEEQEDEQDDATIEVKEEKNEDNSPEISIQSVETEDVEQQDEDIEKVIIEKFLNHVEQEELSLPPGIAKKVEEYESFLNKSKEEWKDEMKEEVERIITPPSQDKKEEKQKNKGDKKKDSPNKQKENKQEEKEKNNEDSFLPPGIEKKLMEGNLPPGWQKKIEELAEQYGISIEQIMDEYLPNIEGILSH